MLQGTYFMVVVSVQGKYIKTSAYIFN